MRQVPPSGHHPFTRPWVSLKRHSKAGTGNSATRGKMLARARAASAHPWPSRKTPAAMTRMPDSVEPLWPSQPALARATAAERLDPAIWAALVAHEPTRIRYQAAVYQRDPGKCWYWLGAISSTGHGKLRAGTRAPGGPPSRVVTAHVYGWHLACNPFTVDPHTGLLPVIRHECDEASCQNPACWRRGDIASNMADYIRRRDHPGSPLTDVRGPAGRAHAIAQRSRLRCASTPTSRRLSGGRRPLGCPAISAHSGSARRRGNGAHACRGWAPAPVLPPLSLVTVADRAGTVGVTLRHVLSAGFLSVACARLCQWSARVATARHDPAGSGLTSRGMIQGSCPAWRQVMSSRRG